MASARVMGGDRAPPSLRLPGADDRGVGQPRPTLPNRAGHGRPGLVATVPPSAIGQRLLQPPPPVGTSLRIDDRASYVVITVPCPPATAWRLVPAAFLAAWLALWGAGLAMIARVLAGHLPGHSLWSMSGLLFWSALWLVGGLVVLLVFARLLVRGRAERLELGAEALEHDPGRPPLMALAARGTVASSLTQEATARWRRPLARGRKHVPREGLEELTLARRSSGALRLTYLCDGQRRELGALASEADKTWLHAVLLAWSRR